MIKEKLTKIQTELKAPKNQFNSFGKYKYRNLEDICEAVKPLLKQENVSLKISDEIIMLGDRYYVKATAILADNEKDDTLTVTAFARESLTKKGMDDSQITGAASSYARKYCLNGLFLIDDTKDADALDNQQDNKPKTITQKQVAEIETLLKETKADRPKFFAWIGVSKVEEITNVNFNKATSALKAKKAKK